MKEYIERAAALDVVKRTSGDYVVTWSEIAHIPAADVAEVVLCKDCQYYQDAKTNKKGFLICPASGMEISETDYCSYGVRMGQEDKHEVKCAKCGEIKEIICTVDGKP